MSIEKVDTLVVGAGQAGLAMSEHLSNCGVPHLVLERHRIAERWRSGRWDSLVANGPAWHDRFPGMEFTDTDPDAFAPKERVADYFVEYAEKIACPHPLRRGGEGMWKGMLAGPALRVETSEGVIEANNVVAATGPFQRPVIPAVVPEDAGIMQIHSNAYRNPGQLPEGALCWWSERGLRGCRSRTNSCVRESLFTSLSARTTVLPGAIADVTSSGGWGSSASGKPRPPEPGTEHVTISVSGARGGHTVDFRRLAAQGMTLVGRTESFKDGVMTFASDLADNIAQGDAKLPFGAGRSRRLYCPQWSRPSGGA